MAGSPFVPFAACAAFGIALHATALAPAVPPPQAPAAPGLTTPMSTPSGARSPARIRTQRKGTVMRPSPRAIAPSGAVAAPTGTAPGAAPAIPDPAALERALSMPENADFRAWYESPHDFAAPRPGRSLVPCADWADDDACIVGRDGNTKIVRAGSQPRQLQVRVSIDRAYGEALESHFGFPSTVLDRIACRTDDGSCSAVEAAVAQALAQHGITCTPERVSPDHQWLLDRSVPAVRDAAGAVLNASLGRGAAPGRRARIEALAGYVQNAVPYRPVKGARDDLMRDGKNRCGLRTPVATLFEGGDCDSKCLLLASMIRSVDPAVPVALVYCTDGDEPHMILAVGCDAGPGEQCIQADGSTLVLIETTSDWDVGHVGTGIDLAEAETVALR